MSNLVAFTKNGKRLEGDGKGPFYVGKGFDLKDTDTPTIEISKEGNLDQGITLPSLQMKFTFDNEKFQYRDDIREILWELPIPKLERPSILHQDN